MKLEEIEKLCNEATPGPWNLEVKEPDKNIKAKFDDDGHHFCGYYTIRTPPYEQSESIILDDTKYYPSAPERLEDAKFIAASRDLIPKLLAIAKSADNFMKGYLKPMQDMNKGRNQYYMCPDLWIEAMQKALDELEKE